MSSLQTSIDNLRVWNSRLFWVTVLVPIVGAVAGGTAGVIRYYVDRREKQLSAQVTDLALADAKREAQNARHDLATSQQEFAASEDAPISLHAYLQLLERSNEHSIGGSLAKKKVAQIQTELSDYELSIPFANALLLVNIAGKEVSTGVEYVPVEDLFANLYEPNISVERRRKLMAHLKLRIDSPDSRRAVLTEARRRLATSDNLPAMAATCGILHWLVRGDLDQPSGWVLDFNRWKLFAEQQLSK
jgi:hypothetical protein